MPRGSALAQPIDDPLASDFGVRQCLERPEGLRAHDEQRARRIDLLQNVGELYAVDIGDAVQADIAIAKFRERLGRHHDAEIRSTDADVDDIGERLAGGAVDPAAVHAFDEGAHLCERSLAPPASRLGHRRTRAGHCGCAMPYARPLDFQSC